METTLAKVKSAEKRFLYLDEIFTQKRSYIFDNLASINLSTYLPICERYQKLSNRYYKIYKALCFSYKMECKRKGFIIINKRYYCQKVGRCFL